MGSGFDFAVFVCERKKWDTARTIFETIEYEDDGVRPKYKLCCSYLMFFNAWFFYEVVVPSAWRYRRVMFFVGALQIGSLHTCLQWIQREMAIRVRKHAQKTSKVEMSTHLNRRFDS